MMTLEALAMVLFAAIAVYVAFTKCPCTTQVDDGQAAYDPSELAPR